VCEKAILERKHLGVKTSVYSGSDFYLAEEGLIINGLRHMVSELEYEIEGMKRHHKEKKNIPKRVFNWIKYRLLDME
jgi:hypothetical protein